VLEGFIPVMSLVLLIFFFFVGWKFYAALRKDMKNPGRSYGTGNSFKGSGKNRPGEKRLSSDEVVITKKILKGKK
jgi:hypothetical protein